MSSLPTVASRRIRWWAILVLVSGLAVTAAAVWLLHARNDALVAQHFEAQVDRIEAQIIERFKLYEFGLRGARGAVLAAGGAAVDRQRFERYSRSRDLASEFPGARGFGFIRRVPRSQIQAFLAAARAEGPADFQIRELAAHEGDRFVIQYIYPEAGNQGATGLDIASEALRRDAAIAASRRAEARLTAPLTLVQASGQVRRGFLILLPVYGTDPVPGTDDGRMADTVGWTYAPLVVDEVLAPLATELAAVGITLTDGSESQPFYDSAADRAETVSYPQRQERKLRVQGREWRLSARALAPLVDAARPMPLALVAAGGAALSLALSLLAYLLLSLRRRDPPRPDAQGVASTTVLAFMRSYAGRGTTLGAALLLGGVLSLAYRDNHRDELQARALSMWKRLDSLVADAQARRQGQSRNIVFLTGIAPVQGIRRAQATGVDPTSGISLSAWRERLEEIFVAYLQAHPEATQLRLIGLGDGGRELVRVQRLQEQLAVTAPQALEPQDMQNFMAAATRLGKGEVHVSRLTLTRGGEPNGRPGRPSSQYLAPVFDGQGRVFGLISLQIDETERLAAIQAAAQGEFAVYVNHAGGDFLVHPDPSRTFGSAAGRAFGWIDAFPADTIGAAGRETVAGLRLLHGPEGPLLIAERLLPGTAADGQDALEFRAVLRQADVRRAALRSLPPVAGQTLALATVLWVLSWRMWAGRQRQRHAEAQRMRLAAIVEQSLDAIVSLDAQGRVVSWNSGAVQTFGYSADEALGRPLGELIAPADGATASADAAVPGTQAGADLEVWRRTKEGRLLLVAITCFELAPARDEAPGVAMVLRDVTLARADAQRVRELNETLERQVVERTAQLQQALSLQSTLLANLPCAVSAYDRELNLLFCNDAYPALLGLEALFAKGRPRFDEVIRHVADRGEYGEGDPEVLTRRILEQVLRPARHRFERTRPNGVSLEIRGAPLPDGGFVTTYTDVSERRRAQQQIEAKEALLRGAIEAVDEAFVLYDPEDRLVFCNEKYRALYERSRDLIVPGMRFEDIVREGAHRGQYAEALGREDAWVAERLERHRLARSEMVQRLDDGRVVRVIEQRLADGHTVGFRIDITELVHAKDAALQAARLKGDFIAMISHEIRTPLNAVLGAAELLKDTPLDREQAQLLDQAAVAGHALLEIVNDILDLSKIEAGQFTLDPDVFEPRRVLDEVLTLHRGQAQRKALVLLGQVAPEVRMQLWGDAGRLRQILNNLVSNALKFTEVGSVTVDLNSIDEADDRQTLRLTVTDTGIGIDAEAQARLFQPFVQAESSTSRRFGGTGLGLSIVKRLAELMRGHVGLSSQVGVGTTFWVELPFDSVSQRQVDAGAGPLRVRLPQPVGEPSDAALADLSVQCRALGWLVSTDSGDPGADVTIRRSPDPGAPAWVVVAEASGSDAPAATPVDLAGAGPAGACPPAALYEAVVQACANQHERLQRLALHGRFPREQMQWLPAARVLVVDDSTVNRDVTRRLLEREGAIVSEASRGALALELLRARPDSVDVVLMDVQMPELDGLETTRRLRQLPALAQVPIVALTAGAIGDDRQRALEVGMTAFLGKPVDPELLVGTLRQVLLSHSGACWPVRPRAPATEPGRDVGLDTWPRIEGIDARLASQALGHDVGLFRSLLGRMLREYADLAALPAQWPPTGDGRDALSNRLPSQAP